MECGKDDPDFERHIEYTKFLSRYSIPVPGLLEAKKDEMQAVFEDLGDISLYSWLKCRREPEQIEAMYRKVLDIAVSIHTKATANVSECPMLQSKVFDYEHFRWETSYFMERFVEGIKGIKVKNAAALDDEFHRLAQKADSFPKTIIHRDFQSHNIMIHKGIPRLIDYQGARIGPPAYDIASMLWDPYHRLKDNMRERLLEYYSGEMAKHHRPTPIESVIMCRLQRHMQALGAYGFLSAVKGKKYFLKYAPEGIWLLKEDVALVKNDYPVLYGLAMEL
jgi:aminoglycoside/choline kinase family phosphotransferase